MFLFKLPLKGLVFNLNGWVLIFLPIYPLILGKFNKGL